MDLDALLTHYFGTADLDTLDDGTIAAGEHRLTMDFATEQDAGRKFGLWVILHTLGTAPAPHDAFEDGQHRSAAIAYMLAAGRLDREED